MIPQVMKAAWVDRYTLHIQFLDGVSGEVDLEKELDGPIFEPLRDLAYFRRFYVDPETHTLAWPNGADFAPEFLYEQIRIPA